MPDRAGRVQPHKYLCPGRAKVLADLNPIVFPEDEWPVPATRRGQLSPSESQLEFVEWAIKSNFAVLLPEDLVPRNSVRENYCSWAMCSSTHTGSSAPYIDRRPQNEQEH